MIKMCSKFIMNHGVRRMALFQNEKKNLKSDNGQRENYYLVLKCGSQVSPSNDILTGTIIKVDVKIKETIFFLKHFVFENFMLPLVTLIKNLAIVV